MPDYDPKSIPILDDVIVTDDNNADDAEARIEPFIAESVIVENEELNADSTENNLDLFSADAIENPLEDSTEQASDNELANPDVDSIDINVDLEEHLEEQLEKPVYATDDQEEATFESALINYSADNETAIDVVAAPEPAETLLEPSSEYMSLNPVSAETKPSISIESIVNDVVEQLMPELEHQLRTLVQQALKEKLPQDILQSEAAAKPVIED